MTALTTHPGTPAVDCVITWVDGSTAAHQKLRAHYMAQSDAPLNENAANPHRWRDNDEIRYCLHSIARHAPWVRHIWIVVDGAGPDLSGLPEAFMARVTIVQHREIFQGFEAALPTFNSLAIESLLWRIEGLSEQFLYFNDDVFLASPLAPSDVFRGGKAVLRGRWVDYSAEINDPAARQDPAKFNYFMQANAAVLAGFDAHRVFKTAHVVHPMKRSVMRALFEQFGAEFARNAHHRFRHISQFLPQGLHNHACITRDQGVLHSGEDHLHIASGHGAGGPASGVRHLLEDAAARGVKFLCINDLPQLEEVWPDIRQWLAKVTMSQQPARPVPPRRPAARAAQS